MMEVLSAEVVVIGGGVIGASAAYYLAREGAEVMIVEAKDLASGASGACDGFLFLQSKIQGPHMDLARESLRLFPDIASDIDVDIEYDRCGSLVLARTAEEIKSLKAQVKKLKGAGLEVEMVGPDDLKELCPAAAPGIKGASYCRDDAQVNPTKLTLGLAKKAQDLGATIMINCRVENIIITNDRVRELRTTAGSIHTRRVVCAAGIGSNQIGKMAIIDVPVMPRKGQILVTEPVERILKTIVAEASYLGVKHGLEGLEPQTEEARKLGLSFTAEQTKDGNILLGSTREYAGFDTETTPEAIKTIARNAVEFLPRVSELDVIRSFAGLRPYSPDGLPIMGTVKGIKGFYLATGHSGDGISLAPITGRLIAELILDGETSMDISPFSLSRFK